MDIWHRISFGRRPKLESELESLGIGLNRSPLPGGNYLVYFDVRESAANWPKVEAAIRYESKTDIVETTFAPHEILATEWVRLRPTFEQGYPQPEKTWIADPANLSQKCPQCGAGHTQIAPFRISREPKMGKNDFLCLYWTYTTFCTKRVVEQLQGHRIRGYEVWDVILHREGTSSLVVSQLVASHLSSSGLAQQDQLKPVTCSRCGITKYAYHTKGYMHYAREAIQTNTDILMTSEWFGSGASAFREILVSHRFAELALSEGWKGIAFKPIELV